MSGRYEMNPIDAVRTENKGFDSDFDNATTSKILLSKPPHSISDSNTETFGIYDFNNLDNDEDDDEGDWCANSIRRLQSSLTVALSKHAQVLKRISLVVLLLGYYIYFAFAISYEFGSEESWRLLVCTVFGTLLLVYYLVSKYKGKRAGVEKREQDTNNTFVERLILCFEKSRLSLILKCLLVGGFILFLIFDVGQKQPHNLISLSGMCFFIITFYIFSYNPSKVKWRPVFWGLTIQIIFALLILRTTVGYEAFKWLGDRITEFLDNTDQGSKFVFGETYENHFFAFKVLPVIVFFSTTVSVLYYLGVMTALIHFIGKFLAMCLGTSPTESISAAANIFLGQTEAPLMIRPFLKDMTNSEIHAIMTGGFATIAGSVMAAYIFYKVPANHLLSASVMSAPAALALSKLFYPETKKTRIRAEDVYKMTKRQEHNLIEAAANGASMSISLVANIAVNLIAFVAMLAFINSTLVWFGDRIGYGELTFQNICSYVFWPIAFLMGVESDDCRVVAELVGIKTFLNEFMAYQELSEYIKNRATLNDYIANRTNISFSDGWFKVDGGIYLNDTGILLEGGVISDRSVVISTYALCGFSNLASMGIQLGALGAMAPERKGDLSRLVFRAMLAGNAACFMTACISGLLYEEM